MSVRRNPTLTEALDAELAIWPYRRCEDGSPLWAYLEGQLDGLSLGDFSSPGEVARHLGARVFLANLRSPRLGWTCFRPDGPEIDVARWLAPTMRELVVAHEVCHIILDRGFKRHDEQAELACNRGANEVMKSLAPR